MFIRMKWMCILLSVVSWNCGRQATIIEQPDICKGRMPGDLVITEYMNDPAGVDTGNEWIELYNATKETVGLKGMAVYVLKEDKSVSKIHVIGDREIAPGSYWVMGSSQENESPDWVSYSYGSDLGNLPASKGTLGIRCDDTVLDEVPISSKGKAGYAQGLDGEAAPDALANDSLNNWCLVQTQINDNSYGTPREPNQICLNSKKCRDPKTGNIRPVRSPKQGELRITEIMANPKGADKEREWMEVYSLNDFDLNEVEISCGKKKTKYSSLDCIPVEAEKYLVFARSNQESVNGGLKKVDQLFSFALPNKGGKISLRSPTEVLAELEYGEAKEGQSLQLDGRWLKQAEGEESNCLSTDKYGDGGNLGSPGLKNRECS